MDNNNIIITIGRQIGSGGSAIAKMLAEEFGARLYDNEILNLAARESGFCEEFFEENDEKKGFFKTALQFHFPLFTRNSYYNTDFNQENLYLFQCDAIRKAASEGSCVFVGRTADYVLRDMDNVVNVFVSADRNNDNHFDIFVCADDDYREKRGQTVYEGKSLKELNRENEKRARYYNYYTGKQWGHCESYDLCINAGRLGHEAATKLIADYARQVMGQANDKSHE